jgi:hypothetical protein
MELDVLPRRDVAEAARILLAHLGQRLQLRRREQALGDLDAQHLRILGLPLAVGAADEAEGSPLVGGDLAALVLVEYGHELVDIGLTGKRQPRTAVGGLIIDD